MSPTATISVSPQVRLTIVKHLAAGRDLDFAAAATHLSVDQVRDVASHHGYPDRNKLAWAVDILQAKADDAAREAIPGRSAGVPAPSTRPTVTMAPSANAPAAARPPDAIEQLLSKARKSAKKRTRTLAAKIDADLDKVRSLLAVEHEAKQQAARAAAEKARAEAEAARAQEEARREVELLEKRLREAKAKLRGGQKSAPKVKASPGGRDLTAIRAWARANGHTVGDKGRVSASIVDAYNQAHAAGGVMAG